MADIDELNLWHGQDLVGYIWKNDLDRIGFRYDVDWLRYELQFPISLQLPLTENEYSPDEGVAHRFFANLLPEGQARTNIVNSLKIPNSDFSILRAIGGECAGAFSVLPYISEPKQQKDWKYEPLAEEQLKTLIDRKGQIYNFKQSDGAPIRLSLAGAQDKCPILVREGEFFIPENEAPSSHILKFQVSDLTHMPAYETILMRLARTIGLPVVEVELKSLEGNPADNPAKSFILITRYDRVWDETGEVVHRLHQEDFCQALGYGYDKKYQDDGGPEFSEIINLIKSYSDEPAHDVEMLLKWQIFNLLSGNSDGHAKNLSILYSGENSLRLAPFYDLVCTRAVEHFDRNLAFAIGGQREPGQINKQNWIDFAKETDTNQRFMLDIVNKLAENILEKFPVVLQEFMDDYGDYEALQRVEQVIVNQCKRTIKSLS
tara:strand:- start:47960 stop:49255 length:1296 start_codon:yes stop_codon:yes gene_type:complete